MSRRRVPGRISLGTQENGGGDGQGRGMNEGGGYEDDGAGRSTSRSSSQPQYCLPLSMQLLKYVPGMHCPQGCCSCKSPTNNNNNTTTTTELKDFLAAAAFSGSLSQSLQDSRGGNPSALQSAKSSINNQAKKDENNNTDNLDFFATEAHEYYDLDSLRHEFTSTSPFVTAPMLLHSHHHSAVTMSAAAASASHRAAEHMLHDYMIICRWYSVQPNAGVLATLRFSLPSLRMTGVFGDTDCLALCELLLHHCNKSLAYVHRLDLGLPSARRDIARLHRLVGSQQPLGIRSHGALALAKVLQSSRHLREVHLQRNIIGPYGASAIFIACASNPSIRKLNLRRCRVGERGALVFCEWIASSETCGLQDIDLSANFIGFKGSLAIERSLEIRAVRQELPYIHVNLEGNLVLQEIMNGVTHGLGVLMAFAGSWLLYQAVHDKPSRHFVSCMVYSASLVVLYISSTLYHSFFILQHTKYIFEVLDKCAIYILIAGSYTPFLQIVLWNDALYSVFLLTFIWVCGFLGICVEAFFPTYRYKQFFSLAMYLGMGWSALICLPEVARKLPEGCTNFMILGGVGYTAGVPFFVRNNNLDHAIWHLFVLAGSFCHWSGIYFYVTDYEDYTQVAAVG